MFPLGNAEAVINAIKISETIVRRILSKLKTITSLHPDQTESPPHFLQKYICLNLLPLIDYISYLNWSQEASRRIDALRYYCIPPKFKKGNQSLPSKYRPIALTCTACKILKSVISIEFIDFLLQNNLISKHQQCPARVPQTPLHQHQNKSSSRFRLLLIIVYLQ